MLKGDWRVPMGGLSRRTSGLRVVVAAVLLLAACTMVACGDDDSSAESAGSGAEMGASSVEGKELAIVMPESIPGYGRAIGCGAAEEGKQLGFEVGEPQAPAKPLDAAGQAQVIQAVLARNPDGLVFAPADATAGSNAIRPAVQDGLPVVAVDGKLADPSLAVSFVSSSHEEGGKLGGRLLAEQIDEEGEVAAIAVVPDHPITIGRIKGFEAAMKEFPGIDVVDIRYPENDPNKIAAEASALLARHPNLKGIYTGNDGAAAGVATALRQSQKTGDVKLITWDLQPVGIKLLREGSATGSVVQRPRELGRIAVQQLANAITGKPVEKEVSAPLTTVTNDQIDDPDVKELYYSTPC